MSTPTGVIPYVEFHQGPKRILTVHLEVTAVLGGTPLRARVAPGLFVDGRQYLVYWGQVHVEVPADRAVHIGVGVQDGLQGASILLPPGEGPAHLRYEVGHGGASLVPAPPG
ncbi:hypothetical protein [uncultured Nocardioides sp.]|uniref:hypothetical protein n=1 Tax=uncultured Nocardioides sp. TaxID=198441 RepID=UPI00261A2AAE|nr:hypothetical protein [uncultured Nocardioides sp.]